MLMVSIPMFLDLGKLPAIVSTLTFDLIVQREESGGDSNSNRRRFAIVLIFDAYWGVYAAVV
jgi:hypothetical protein